MTSSTKTVILDLNSFFHEMVTEAIHRRNLSTYPLVSKYLVDLLKSFTSTSNFEMENTLAEMYLKALQEESQKIKYDKLKKLGELSLYISGFFGDSLKRKVVDIDYYAEIGGRAYDCLASETQEDTYAKVYGEISIKFLDFVDVLTLVSQKSLIQSNEDLLRLYDRYISTGSKLAKEQLLEKGLITTDIKKTEQ